MYVNICINVNKKFEKKKSFESNRLRKPTHKHRGYEKDIIIHAKRAIVFNNGEPWEKKDSQTGFDITMGSFDGAESCKIVVAYMLSQLQ